MAAEVFICGCGHSGTSLIANMFAAHPTVFVPLRETYVFKDPARAQERYGALLEEATATRRPFMVEKTPGHIHHIDLIRCTVPRARFILPVRDGRDVVASIARRTGSVDQGIKRWIVDNGIVLAQRDRDDVFTYRHEDLVEDTDGVLRSACAFAGIPFDAAMLDYHQTARLWFGQRRLKEADPSEKHKAHRNWQINQPVFDNRGRWVDELTPEQVQPLLEGPGLHLMRAFGYVPEIA
ncbi:MAG: sulfotransferase [Solirubrobacteraceae bacterium]